MILQVYTIVHVIISLVALLAGLFVLFGLLTSHRLDCWTKCFWITIVATVVTGFFFPFHGLTPAINLGLILLPIMAIGLFARYSRQMTGAWRWIYVLCAVLSIYFNIFVFIVQSFQKIPALHALAPTQTEQPFQVTQLAVLLLFGVLGLVALFRFRPEPA